MIYTQRMGKLGGIILLSALVLSGCAAAPTAMEPAAASSQRPMTNELRGVDAEFISAVYASGTSYAKLPAASLFEMGKEICEHYAGGFTTDDLRASDGDRLALVGEAARATICR